MHLTGIIQSADLVENPPGSDQVEMILRVQGVKPGQPRRLVIPFPLLVSDPTLDPDAIRGHGFAAEVAEEAEGRWVVGQIAVASGRVLRPEE
jgi:hypothetical protein